MVETRFDELKRSVAEPHFRRIAREFYERISRFTLPIGHESAALAGDSA